MKKGRIYKDNKGQYQVYLGLGYVPKEVSVRVKTKSRHCGSYEHCELRKVQEIQTTDEVLSPIYLTVYKNNHSPSLHRSRGYYPG